MKDQVAARPRVRRQHEQAFKNDLIAQSLVPGASVSAIAMRGGINANLLFKWRREHLRVSVQPPRLDVEKAFRLSLKSSDAAAVHRAGC